MYPLFGRASQSVAGWRFRISSSLTSPRIYRKTQGHIASSKVEKPLIVTKITEMISLSHYIAAQTNSDKIKLIS